MTTYELFKIPLAYPLLIAKAPKGVLVCGYLNLATFEATGEACAMVTGVNDLNDMLKAKVAAVTSAAQLLGVQVGISGEETLQKMQ